jgi:hypothetical protein
MGALQQLSMEIYNDGMAAAASSIHRGDETFDRGRGVFADPELVRERFLPACERKIEIAKAMIAEHEAFDLSGLAENQVQLLRLYSEFLTVFMARARTQQSGITDWLDDPTIDVDTRMSTLDSSESLAMMTSIGELNRLIEQAGLSGEPWLVINCDAFNQVRHRIGVPPLLLTDFRARFLQGIAGGRARMFE